MVLGLIGGIVGGAFAASGISKAGEHMEGGIIKAGDHVGRGIGKAGEYLGSGISTAGAHMGNGIARHGAEIGQGINKAGKHVSDSVTTAGKYVGDGLVTIGKNLVHVGKGVEGAGYHIAGGIDKAGKHLGGGVEGGMIVLGYRVQNAAEHMKDGMVSMGFFIGAGILGAGCAIGYSNNPTVLHGPLSVAIYPKILLSDFLTSKLIQEQEEISQKLVLPPGTVVGALLEFDPYFLLESMLLIEAAHLCTPTSFISLITSQAQVHWIEMKQGYCGMTLVLFSRVIIRFLFGKRVIFTLSGVFFLILGSLAWLLIVIVISGHNLNKSVLFTRLAHCFFSICLPSLFIGIIIHVWEITSIATGFLATATIITTLLCLNSIAKSKNGLHLDEGLIVNGAKFLFIFYIISYLIRGTAFASELRLNTLIMHQFDIFTDYELYAEFAVFACVWQPVTQISDSVTHPQHIAQLSALSRVSGSCFPFSFVGSAIYVPGPKIQLTPKALSQCGAFWVPIKTKFSKTPKKITTNFTFRAHGPGADGLALVLQSSSSLALGLGGSGLGYSTIPASIAIEFDMHQSINECCDPDGNHISIQYCGPVHANSAHHNYSVACNSSIPNLASGKDVYVCVVYSYSCAGTITDYDGIVQVFMSHHQSNDLALVLQANSLHIEGIVHGIHHNKPNCWIGVTAATGAVCQIHEIVEFDVQVEGFELQ
ncbi:peptide-N4-(N-acetyl-beta- glucosaminyl)asparagine amidase [Physocladia obscura]|uniref:Peptide-N4-(N-acetyl-beta-glucosaminyl)asparagine amidase n=1 Tax=Physocladia obscura TaxID=109957 RepID=A0AAD5XHM6_9FUNG|nr:peptide-N4-(N-acetyl-beta- glucosaminyl)asparagine amidase [Physocladia obscura]